MDRVMIVVKMIKTTRRPEGRPFWWMTEAAYRRLEDKSAGFCLVCRDEVFGVESDARGYTCEACGEKKVYGVLAMMEIGRLEVVEPSEISKVKALP